MKLLLIEDNRSLAESLKRHLGKNFIVDIAATGEQGQEHAQTNNYDVIILDLNLPDTHGREVCATIRKNGITTPILILTGNADLASCVELLDRGADDYIHKPFNIAELKARINALLRRAAAAYSDNVIIIRDLTIDLHARHVSRGNTEIILRRKEFDILEYLARNRGRTLTRAMIFDHVWEADKDSWHNTVDVHIKHLRDKVDKPFAVPLIKTAYGIGYLIEDSNE